MKTKEYIEKYHLDKVRINKGTSNKMIIDLSDEFDEICDKFNIDDNYRKFQSAVKEIRQKWDSISKKSKFMFTETLWNFFYASVICKKRAAICPTFHKRVEDKKRRKAEYEAKHKKDE